MKSRNERAMFIILGAVALLFGGYYLSRSHHPRETVLKPAEEIQQVHEEVKPVPQRPAKVESAPTDSSKAPVAAPPQQAKQGETADAQPLIDPEKKAKLLSSQSVFR